MHYENVNRIYYLFRHFFIFIIIDQNICFFSFYVNLVFHIQFLWIMWITLCITQFPRKFRHFEMWITFAPKSTLSTFFDKLVDNFFQNIHTGIILNYWEIVYDCLYFYWRSHLTILIFPFLVHEIARCVPFGVKICMYIYIKDNNSLLKFLCLY